MRATLFCLFAVLIATVSAPGIATAARLKPAPAGSGYVLACQGGGNMQISGGGAVLGGSSFFIVSFEAAAQGANAAPPDPGTCAWTDRALRPGEPLMLNVPNDLAEVGQLKEAIAGGTFQVHANNDGQDLVVNQIDDVQVVDSTPLSPGLAVTNGSDDDSNSASGSSVLQPPIAEDNSEGQPLMIAKAANVHKTAALGSVFHSLAAGTEVTSLGCSKGWCLVQFPGGEGYVSQSFTAPE